MVPLKRWLLFLLLFLLMTIGTSALAAEDPPASSAEAEVMVDADSGRVLYEKNPHEQRSIASITKLMTALLATEHWGNDLSETVEVQATWANVEGSSMYLKAGEYVTREELLYGLMLSSGNDAALTIAGSCAGNIDTFVSWMNQRAEELGMKDTHFSNPNGLDEKGHYSTAYDMSLLAMECIKNDTLSKIVGTKSITLGTRTFVNHNKLLWRYDGCIGMKTGYTEEAGRTLISCAQRDGERIIIVTLKDPNDWVDHAKLYEYAFSHWKEQSLCKVSESVSTIPVKGSLIHFVNVVPSEDFSYPLAEGESLRTEISLPDSVEAPVLGAETAGSITYYLGNVKVKEVTLLYQDSVRREVFTDKSLLQHILDLFKSEKASALVPKLICLELPSIP